jgi:hypothetical protein
VRLREIIDELPPPYALPTAKEKLERLIAPAARSDDPPVFALDGVLLVDDVADPRWQQLDHARLTADERAYDEALIPFLADLARGDPHVARGLVSRMEAEEPGRAARLARGLLDRAGPALPEDIRQRLSRIASQTEMRGTPLTRPPRLGPGGRLPLPAGEGWGEGGTRSRNHRRRS